MTITYFFIKLNHHEVNVADELYKLIGQNFTFVELCNLPGDNKGCAEKFENRPYILRAWENRINKQKAMELAVTSDVALFVGYESIKYQIERMKQNKLSFEVSERWLKRGIMGILSPHIFCPFVIYHIRQWKRKKLFKLCSSAFAANDHKRLGMYKNKCFKWGYFTATSNRNTINKTNINHLKLIWCGRFINWKHPEIPIRLAANLKKSGYNFSLCMYGDGPLLNKIKKLSQKLNLANEVKFYGAVSNKKIREAMHYSDILLLTSDKKEGWGAVANEAMSEGCIVIGSDEIGSVPFLIKHGENGFIFKSKNDSDLLQIVIDLINRSQIIDCIKQNAQRTINDVWNPHNAAISLLTLIRDLQNGEITSIKEGPCSFIQI